ncbi:hypothetical protein EVAR_32390_1 [Eumeta japonica]|uniref:Uncharacterized protein n=1 Tax=Eumeta variegata TaxID=151549 RepID=A0A4C1VLY4_EUMVA|nr:hypothetical protein EVAR_32390_1 [Eumeta japonica]
MHRDPRLGEARATASPRTPVIKSESFDKLRDERGAERVRLPVGRMSRAGAPPTIKPGRALRSAVPIVH